MLQYIFSEGQFNDSKEKIIYGSSQQQRTEYEPNGGDKYIQKRPMSAQLDTHGSDNNNGNNYKQGH